MQFITTDQRIAVENFEIGLIYTVTFTSGSYFLGACIGKGANYVMFQRTAPELIFSLTMAAAADVESIEPLPDDIGKIIEYTGSVPVSIKTNGSPLLAYTIKGNDLPGTGDKTANLLNPESKSTNQQGAERWGGVFPAGTYYVLNNTVDNVYYRDGVSSTSSTAIIPNRGAVITTTDELVIWHGSKSEDIMVAESSTALPFEPYGYKIPILSGDTTTNIYIDNPLRKSLDGTAVDELSSNGKLTQRVDTDGSILSTPIISYIDMVTIPTTNGLNIFDIDTTVKPSEVYIKYFSPLL